MRIPESDEVAAYQYRLAQTNRLLRYCVEQGVDAQEVMAGRIKIDLDPICGQDGKIVPEDVDFRAIRTTS